MRKDYKKWMGQKAEINNAGVRPKRHYEGGIYWAYLGENVGYEQDGQGPVYSRPVLIAKSFRGGIAICLPISHTVKDSPLYYPIEIGEIKGSVLLSQIRAIDTLRVGKHIVDVPDKLLRDIKRAISRLIMS